MVDLVVAVRGHVHREVSRGLFGVLENLPFPLNTSILKDLRRDPMIAWIDEATVDDSLAEVYEAATEATESADAAAIKHPRSENRPVS